MFSATGHRALLHKPSRGTPLSIVRLRLQPLFYKTTLSNSRVTISASSLSISACRDLVYSQFSCSHVRIQGYATVQSQPTISDQEVALIQDMLQQHRSNTRQTAKPENHGQQKDVKVESAAGEDMPLSSSATAHTDPTQSPPNPFRQALEAMQQEQTRRLLRHLRRIINMGMPALQDAVAALPRTTLTEFLRSLDPFYVARNADPTDEAYISRGMFTLLSMESVVDDWGVRKLYVRLLQRMLALMAAMKASGHVLQMEEYTYLLRCAGAASDPVGAKIIWQEMDHNETQDWRQSDAYAEFISARFLTEPSYTSHDKTRRMVLPRNLHRSRLRLNKGIIHRLDRLRFNLRLNKHGFGLNKDVNHAEDIMRMLRKTRPITKVYMKFLTSANYVDEKLLCAIMVAFGRAGSLRYIASLILERYFGIRLTRLSYAERAIDVQTVPKNSLIVPVARRIRPTVRLMRAVTEVYGCNGEISIAFQLVDYLSHTYKIPIPLSVWHDLLEWTLIMSSSWSAASWKIAGMYSKVPSQEAVEMIWDTMIAAPYHVRPGYDQYSILVRSLLKPGRYPRALPFMREGVLFYTAQCQKYEAAVFEYVQSLRDGISADGPIQRLERARFKKQQMWYDIQTWCRRYLQLCQYDVGPDSPVPHPSIPAFVEEFRQFMRNPLHYGTPTGYVSLVDPAMEQVLPISTGDFVMNVPIKYKRGWVHQRVRRRRHAILSSHSLAEKTTTKLNPLTLLSGQWNTFRTVQPERRVQEEPATEPATHFEDDDDI